MENSAALIQPKKKLSIRRILIILVGIVLLATVIVFAVKLFHYTQLVNQVKDALTTASLAESSQASIRGMGYPTRLPNGALESKTVKIAGSGSFDGKSYCITGTSNKDKTIVYYIDSSMNSPQKGSCGGGNSPVATGPLVLDLVDANDINVSWTAAPYADSYNLECATDKNFTANLVKKKGNDVRGVCDGLLQGTGYYLRVQGVNQSGAGPWSEVIVATTTALSVVPTNLKATPLSAAQISYSWSAVAGATSYVVEWSSDVNFVQNVQTISQTATSGTSRNLISGTMYWYHVKAVTANFDAQHAAFSSPLSATTP